MQTPADRVTIDRRCLCGRIARFAGVFAASLPLVFCVACSTPPAVSSFRVSPGTLPEHRAALAAAVNGWNVVAPDETPLADFGEGDVEVDFHPDVPCDERPYPDELGGFEGRYIDIWSTCLHAEAEIRFTILHEVGHSLGLEHVPDRMAVMFPALNADLTAPTDADRIELRRVLYAD